MSLGNKEETTIMATTTLDAAATAVSDVTPKTSSPAMTPIMPTASEQVFRTFYQEFAFTLSDTLAAINFCTQAVTQLVTKHKTIQPPSWEKVLQNRSEPQIICYSKEPQPLYSNTLGFRCRRQVAPKMLILPHNYHLFVASDCHENFHHILPSLLNRLQRGETCLLAGDFFEGMIDPLDTFIALLKLKQRFPENFHCLLGNHDLVDFRYCLTQYGPKMVKAFEDFIGLQPEIALAVNEGTQGQTIMDCCFITHAGLPSFRDTPQEYLASIEHETSEEGSGERVTTDAYGIKQPQQTLASYKAGLAKHAPGRDLDVSFVHGHDHRALVSKESHAGETEQLTLDKSKCADHLQQTVGMIDFKNPRLKANAEKSQKESVADRWKTVLADDHIISVYSGAHPTRILAEHKSNPDGLIDESTVAKRSEKTMADIHRLNERYKIFVADDFAHVSVPIAISTKPHHHFTLDTGSDGGIDVIPLLPNDQGMRIYTQFIDSKDAERLIVSACKEYSAYIPINDLIPILCVHLKLRPLEQKTRLDWIQKMQKKEAASLTYDNFLAFLKTQIASKPLSYSDVCSAMRSINSGYLNNRGEQLIVNFSPSALGIEFLIKTCEIPNPIEPEANASKVPSKERLSTENNEKISPGYLLDFVMASILSAGLVPLTVGIIGGIILLIKSAYDKSCNHKSFEKNAKENLTKGIHWLFFEENIAEDKGIHEPPANKQQLGP